MNPTTTAVQQVLSQLAGMGQLQGRSFAESWKFALSWLVGGQLVRQGLLGADTRLSQLVEPDVWARSNLRVGVLARDIIWRKLNPTLSESALSRALTLVTDFYEQGGAVPWNIADALWQLPGSRSETPVIAPEVCDLLFAALRPEPGCSVWLPFDPVGQLLCRAVRLGLEAVTAGPGQQDRDMYLLIRQLAQSASPNVRAFEVDASDRDHSDLHVEYLVACPPLAVRLDPALGWLKWGEAHNLNATHFLHLAQKSSSKRVEVKRSETWALAALWPRVRRSATFLVSPSILFAGGQEQDLRDTWLRRDCPLQSVVMLPPRQLAAASTQTALLALSHKGDERTVLMADATDLTRPSVHGPRAPRALDLLRLLTELDLRLPGPLEREESQSSFVDSTVENSTPITMRVPTADIRSQDGNLTPSRYLKAPLDLPGKRNKLGAVVDVIRAPLPTEGAAGELAVEVGIPDLGQWRPLRLTASPGCDETNCTRIAPRKLEDVMLMREDIVMSIKGTVGKLGLIDQPYATAAPSDNTAAPVPLVASHNCIAIRVRKGAMLPKFLYLYLKSPEFDLQLAALLSGAVISHVKPADLLRSILVPVPPLHEQMNALEKLDQLCRMEEEVESLEQRMHQLRKQLWGGSEHGEG